MWMLTWRAIWAQKIKSAPSAQNSNIFHIKRGILELQFLGFENSFITEWATQNISFPYKILLLKVALFKHLFIFISSYTY